MTILFEIGYLETDYLVGIYFQGTAYDGLGMQVDRQIADSMTIESQAERVINQPGVVDSQVDRFVSGVTATLSEVDRLLIVEPTITLAEVDRKVTPAPQLTLMEVSTDRIEQGDCDEFGYHLTPYLAAPYMAGFVCADLLMQVERKPAVFKPTLAEVDRKINATKTLLSEVDRQIIDTKSVRSQVEAKKSKSIGAQVRKVLYNTYNLRILWDFPSRGTNGTNWTVTVGEQSPGDFSVNNLNTDVVEQAFRTPSLTNCTVVCDTQISNGVFVDTIGILGHNLRVTGSVRVEASQSSSFSDPELYILRPDGTENIIWIAPTIPLTSYRYWRFTFSDASNADGFLQVGSIVFGSAAIFQGENVVDTIVKTPKHFADKVMTEGFTAVSNDRALKNAVTLEFRSLDYNRENYALLQQIFNYCRTSLKALWVPAPRTPTRFGVFGKLATIPSEQHQAMGDDADYVSFTLEVDESL